ncbi:MAG TPA: hypothetical protein VM284_00480 [Candidatus Limnocylindria bacterium]|nr:hypothetical protein [Candidatus Limnocylindria bacterium]
MSVAAVARPSSLRDIPWAVWLLLAFAAALALYIFSRPGYTVIGGLATIAPIVFAAAVVYVKPADQRFMWAALFLAATPVVGLIAGVFPDAWFAYAPGDWKNGTPLMRDVASLGVDVARILGLVGLFLFGLALGGVRSFVPFLIMALGLVLAVGNLIWTFAHPIDDLPLYDLAKTLSYAVLRVVGLAFVFAAAVESLRSLTMTGAGFLFLNAAIGAVLLWWTIGTGANFDVLSLVLGGTSLLGWIALIAAPLRGEFSAAPPRSRVGRESASRRRAG